jgi:hypothetical protein
MYNFDRFMGVTFFESSSPSRLYELGRITAAATTGPANGPRPASSTPAIIAIILFNLLVYLD